MSDQRCHGQRRVARTGTQIEYPPFGVRIEHFGQHAQVGTSRVYAASGVGGGHAVELFGRIAHGHFRVLRFYRAPAPSGCLDS